MRKFSDIISEEELEKLKFPERWVLLKLKIERHTLEQNTIEWRNIANLTYPSSIYELLLTNESKYFTVKLLKEDKKFLITLK